MAMQDQTPNSALVPTTHKDYVTVVARHELGGRIRPVAYQLPGGSPVKIDCITDERQAASLKSGGQGTRYTCKVTVDEVQLNEGITTVITKNKDGFKQMIQDALDVEGAHEAMRGN